MNNQNIKPDNLKPTKVTDIIDQNPLKEDRTTWWSLIKMVASDKTSWIIILGMGVLLLGYFSYELFSNKIKYDKDGFFSKIKVDRIVKTNADAQRNYIIKGIAKPGTNVEIYINPTEKKINPVLDANGHYSIKLTIPNNYLWIYGKTILDGNTSFFRIYLPNMRNYSIQKKDYDVGIKMIEKRWESLRSFWYEPSKSVNLIIQGLIFFFGAIIAALILGINPFKLGLKLGDFKNWVPITALFILIMLPVFYYVAHSDAFKNSYPSDYSARDSIEVFWIITFSYLVYFLGWEFIFRGYFLMALKDRIGVVPAILFQMIPFAAMHINKPPLEAMSSIVGGVVLGILVIRVRSFWPCIIIHWVLHASINYFVCTIHYW
ncbi:MAG: CPBP family intramembrane metalloprotease [Planctomycetes bacterium]|nr:CPBP family intramembrane metalloprotease [Planctomycetota bacterium]